MLFVAIVMKLYLFLTYLYQKIKMKHTIQKLNNKIEYLDDKKNKISLEGYAFIDEQGHCIIIVYGEGRRDEMSKYLNGNSDELELKYRILILNEKHEN